MLVRFGLLFFLKAFSGDFEVAFVDIESGVGGDVGSGGSDGGGADTIEGV